MNTTMQQHGVTAQARGCATGCGQAFCDEADMLVFVNAA